ncbi:MAG: DUF4097 family beta strand repeat protein [Limnochordaceae bacterium]|nr:DUF4097 family beta strand repeat protein [Limnochordaceae bacterium]
MTVRLEVETSNGSVAVRGVRGTTVDVRSSNGRIDLSQVEAQRVVARTSNGSLVLDGVQADVLEARSSNGAVTGSVGGAEMEVSTSNGSVTLRPLWRPEGAAHQRLDVQASNGGVRVILPAAVREAAERKELGLSLRASTNWGSTQVEVPGTVLITQTARMGRQQVEHQSPHLAESARTLHVDVRTITGSASITSE